MSAILYIKNASLSDGTFLLPTAFLFWAGLTYDAYKQRAMKLIEKIVQVFDIHRINLYYRRYEYSLEIEVQRIELGCSIVALEPASCGKRRVA